MRAGSCNDTSKLNPLTLTLKKAGLKFEQIYYPYNNRGLHTGNRCSCYICTLSMLGGRGGGGERINLHLPEWTPTTGKRKTIPPSSTHKQQSKASQEEGEKHLKAADNKGSDLFQSSNVSGLELQASNCPTQTQL